MRGVLGIVVGLIVSLIVAVIVGIFAFLATASIPPGTDAGDTRQVIAILINMTQATQIALSVAWLASAFAGAVAAKLIARKAWAAWAIALVVAIYFGLDALLLPLPLWVKAAWIVGPLVGGLLANRLVGAAPAVVITEAEAPPANP